MFAALFRAGGQPSSLALRQKNSRKRKRSESSSDEEFDKQPRSPLTDEDVAPTPASSFHPVNRTDQYYVAGHPREGIVPAFPFPHAPSVKPSRISRPLIDKELEQLNPPLFVPPHERGLHSQSLKRQHVENLTTILHGCMLRGDWNRASRTWGLLLRTEVGGRGVDVRKHGRWAVGAELLMRRDQQPTNQIVPENDSFGPERDLVISDQGFRLAREYYERLILQYPHTSRTQHRFTALAVYPALFNIWIFEVQDRSKRARRKDETDRPSSRSSSSDVSNTSNDKGPHRAVRQRELHEALEIVQRMDELLISPPFDTSLPLLHLRGLAGLWIADIYSELSQQNVNDYSDMGAELRNDSEADHSRDRAETERAVAFRLLSKARDGGEVLPDNIIRFLHERRNKAAP